MKESYNIIEKCGLLFVYYFPYVNYSDSRLSTETPEPVVEEREAPRKHAA